MTDEGDLTANSSYVKLGIVFLHCTWISNNDRPSGTCCLVNTVSAIMNSSQIAGSNAGFLVHSPTKAKNAVY